MSIFIHPAHARSLMKIPILRKCNDALNNTSFLGTLVYMENLEISIVGYRVREQKEGLVSERKRYKSLLKG